MAHSGTIIHMRNVPGKPLLRALDEPLPIVLQSYTSPLPKDGVAYIPKDFTWDGSSVPWLFQGFFPRHRHPIASCRHDWRCKHARNMDERKWADRCFREDVGTTSWWVTKWFGYIGVRIGAYLGIGCRF